MNERLPCPSCGTLVDEDGYCTDVGCPNCGKAVIEPRMPVEEARARIGKTVQRNLSIGLRGEPLFGHEPLELRALEFREDRRFSCRIHEHFHDTWRKDEVEELQ